ncbi:cell division protein FtsQ/DivIB [Paenibacillus sp. 1P07SE]|uniref:cell division protein FtsQ/DivIB n=1 Tax=Paenibacillus sp. 1P07SE TaxID=3132209 RepID=UPI0039A43A5F
MSDPMPILREPKTRRRSNRKLIAVLFLLFLILLTVLFFNSSISKISSITISGNYFVSNEEILEAAGLGVGEAFFGLDTVQVAERIKAGLEPVQDAVMAKSFPGKVSIHVQEYPTVAFEISPRGEMTAILAGGAQVEVQGRDHVVDKPVLSMWDADDPHKAELSRLLGEIPPEQLSDLSEIIPYPSKSYPDRIKIYTRTQFEVVTAISLLREKLSTLHAVVETQEPGKLTLLLADTYTPYVPETSESEDSNEN